MAKHMVPSYTFTFTDNDIKQTLAKMGLKADARACYDIARWLKEDFWAMLHETKSMENYAYMVDDDGLVYIDGIEEIKED